MVDLSRFRAVILDFDGVIVDSETVQARAWTRVARELGQSERLITARDIAGRIDRELAAELFPGCDAAPCAIRKAEFESEMLRAGELKLVPGVEAFLGRAASRHPLAICSSCNARLLERRLLDIGLRSTFGVVVGRIDGLPHKPAPDLYLRALEQLRIGVGEACAIEDSLTGVAAARAAGIFTIQLVHPDLPRADNADAWIKHFDELIVDDE
jgi:HAD superfamily hydrolase (TIGR01509 family)